MVLISVDKESWSAIAVSGGYFRIKGISYKTLRASSADNGATGIVVTAEQANPFDEQSHMCILPELKLLETGDYVLKTS